jgi:hypothetical protein
MTGLLGVAGQAPETLGQKPQFRLSPAGYPATICSGSAPQSGENLERVATKMDGAHETGLRL